MAAADTPLLMLNAPLVATRLGYPDLSGLDLLEHARAMGTAAEALGLAASGRSQAVGGVVSVSATDVVATHLLPPILQRLRAQAPGIAVEVISSNALSDLQRREADIAIRHVQPEQPELIARLVREARACFYASESWVQAHGHPRLRARHLPFTIASRERDQWLMCMQLAFDECLPESPLRSRLWTAIEGLADHMRNRADPA